MTIGRWFAIAAGFCAVSAAGCGDNDNECPSDIVVVISTPADDAVLSAADDNDPLEEGIQIAVTVRSNLDIDADGVEDLVIVGGRGPGLVRAFIWFGGALPLGSVTSASAQHTVTLPSDFRGFRTGGQSTPISAIWAGDVNDDGLTDICIGDTSAQSFDGAFTFLWDEGP